MLSSSFLVRPQALGLLAAALLLSPPAPAQPAPGATHESCAEDTGLTLPPGFCATVFADDVGFARHMVVAPNGVVYVNTWSGHAFGNRPPPPGGFIVALQDTHGSGKADVIKRFGKSPEQGAHGGVGIALYKGRVYVEESDRIERYTLAQGSIIAARAPEVVVTDMPMGGDHPMHPFAIDASGGLYVDMGSATNACQAANRQPKSPGIKPCTELETRGGIWRFDANKLNQKFSATARFATGIRNGEGIAPDASGHTIYVTQHGRDQLYQNWPERYRQEQEATLPAEEVVKLRRGADYGWPECYYDQVQRKLVLAPEYGGDGGKTVGVCRHKVAPVADFPAHWAPNDMVIYTGKSFPGRYRNGAFIAFHGSWDRAPYPQGGYNVVFQPLTDGAARARCEIFADGFAGKVKEPGAAERRPSGVAVGPDGALYISEDKHGRIYRVTYHGAPGAAAAGTPCPPPDAPAGEPGTQTAGPPEGVHPNAAEAATLPVPTGATREMVEAGADIFHGRVGGATCTGCHGSDGKGSPLGPDLTSRTRLWGDGSYPSIVHTIREGVPRPKQFNAPMPPMGGAQLTAEQVAAVAAYVWALGHR